MDISIRQEEDRNHISQEEAIEKALDDAPENAWLCVQCAGEFEDAGELDENSIVAEEIR